MNENKTWAALDKLYDAATHPENWESALETFYEMYEGIGANLLILDSAQQQTLRYIAAGRNKEQFVQEIDQYFPSHPLTPYMAQNPQAKFFHSALVNDPALPGFHMYREWEKGVMEDNLFFVGEKLFSNASIDAMVTFVRPESEGHPSDEALTHFRRFMPHIRNAVAITQALDNKAISDYIMNSGHDVAGSGLLILSESGEILFCNQIAEDICQAQDGLTIKNRKFQAQRNKEQQQIEKMLFQAGKFGKQDSVSGDGALIVERPSGKMPYLVSILPYKNDPPIFSAHVPTTLAIIRDPERKIMRDLQALCDYFDLSHQEAKIVTCLLDNRGVNQIARSLNITVNAVHSSLRRIYKKTGVSGQVELTLLLSRYLG